MRVIALIVRAGAVAVAAGFLFSLVIDGSDPPAVAARTEAATTGTVAQTPAKPAATPARSKSHVRPGSSRSRPPGTS